MCVPESRDNILQEGQLIQILGVPIIGPNRKGVVRNRNAKDHGLPLDSGEGAFGAGRGRVLPQGRELLAPENRLIDRLDDQRLIQNPLLATRW